VLLTISLPRQVLCFLGASPRTSQGEAAARVEGIVSAHIDAVWRTARRLGVASRDIEDVAQEVMLVVLRRVDDIELDRERAFVLATTVRVVANWRRSRRRHPEELTDCVEHVVSRAEHYATQAADNPEQALERVRKLELLQAALHEMTEPQQGAFIMFELEQMTASEIARELQVPQAAIVSRVRRAREVFARCLARHRQAHSEAHSNVRERRRGA
jgi:RNA polymerase sigma-70 factor (ECF subfamily)